jgi:TolA-binding protein
MLLLEFQQIESMVRVKGFSRKSVSQKQWTQWQQTYPDIISSLVYAYKSTGQIDDAKSVLNDWLQKYPNDKAAKKMLESFEEKG